MKGRLKKKYSSLCSIFTSTKFTNWIWFISYTLKPEHTWNYDRMNHKREKEIMSSILNLMKSHIEAEWKFKIKDDVWKKMNSWSASYSTLLLFLSRYRSATDIYEDMRFCHIRPNWDYQIVSHFRPNSNF